TKRYLKPGSRTGTGVPFRSPGMKWQDLTVATAASVRPWPSPLTTWTSRTRPVSLMTRSRTTVPSMAACFAASVYGGLRLWQLSSGSGILVTSYTGTTGAGPLAPLCASSTGAKSPPVLPTGIAGPDAACDVDSIVTPNTGVAGPTPVTAGCRGGGASVGGGGVCAGGAACARGRSCGTGLGAGAGGSAAGSGGGSSGGGETTRSETIRTGGGE